MVEDETIDKKALRKANIKKGVYLLPNLLTSVTLFGGFYAIVACLDGNYEFAALAIIIAGVFDGIDGRVARLTGTSSKFGMEYDSLADLVAFGLAPGILMFTWALRPFGRYGWLAAFLFVVCGALRLARFNVQSETVESKRFIGLPIPAAAGMVASTVYFFSGITGETFTQSASILALVYTLAFLMVSNVRYYSFKELNLQKRMPFRFLVAVILLLVVIAAEPPLMLFSLATGYVLSGPIGTAIMWRRRKFGKPAAGESNPGEHTHDTP